MNQPLRADLAAFAADANGLKNPTVLSVGEAQGHGFYLDDKSLDAAMRLLIGKSLPSYLKHDGAGNDRLGQEIGYLSGIYRDGEKLKAQAFEYFDSFKKEAAATYEKLAEMAQKVPEMFGFSPVITYRPVWVMGDGSEKPAQLGDKAPAGAIRAIPSARILGVQSADMVRRPAVNLTGLLSAVDAEANQQPPKPIMDTPAATPDATAALSNAPVATPPPYPPVSGGSQPQPSAPPIPAQVVVKLSESDEGHKAALAKVEADHTAALKAKDEAHVAALAAKDAEIAELNKKHADEVHAIRAELDLAHKNSAAALGVPPLKYTKELKAELSTPEAKLSFYEKITDKNERKIFREKNPDMWSANLSRK